MPMYSFVLKETNQGKLHHDDPSPGGHLDRRATATGKAINAGCRLPHQVTETMIPKANGDWYYFWVLDAPNLGTVNGLIKEYTVNHRYVDLYSGPTDVT
jgi:hypothetical protein